MDARTELSYLRGLDKDARRSAMRPIWMLPAAFALAALVSVAVKNRTPAFAFAFLAPAAVLVLGYAYVRHTNKSFGTPMPAGSFWVALAVIVLLAVGAAVTGAVYGPRFLAWCGPALVVALGLVYFNVPALPFVTWPGRFVLAAPSVVMATASVLGYVEDAWALVALAIPIGLVLQSIAGRWIVAR